MIPRMNSNSTEGREALQMAQEIQQCKLQTDSLFKLNLSLLTSLIKYLRSAQVQIVIRRRLKIPGNQNQHKLLLLPLLVVEAVEAVEVVEVALLLPLLLPSEHLVPQVLLLLLFLLLQAVEVVEVQRGLL